MLTALLVLDGLACVLCAYALWLGWTTWREIRREQTTLRDQHTPRA